MDQPLNFGFIKTNGSPIQADTMQPPLAVPSHERVRANIKPGRRLPLCQQPGGRQRRR